LSPIDPFVTLEGALNAADVRFLTIGVWGATSRPCGN